MPNHRARQAAAALRAHQDLPHLLVVGEQVLADALALAFHRLSVAAAGMPPVPCASEAVYHHQGGPAAAATASSVGSSGPGAADRLSAVFGFCSIGEPIRTDVGCGGASGGASGGGSGGGGGGGSAKHGGGYAGGGGCAGGGGPPGQMLDIRAVHAWLAAAPPCIDGRRRTALALRVSEWPADAVSVLKNCMETRGVWWVLSAGGAGASRLSASVRGMCVAVPAAPSGAAAAAAFANRAKPGLPAGTWEFLLRSNGGSLAAALGAAPARTPPAAPLAAAFKAALRQWTETEAAVAVALAATQPAASQALTVRRRRRAAARALREAACRAVASGATPAALATSVLRAAEQLSRSTPEPRRSRALLRAAEVAAELDAALVRCRRAVAWVLHIEAALTDTALALARAPPSSPSSPPARRPPPAEPAVVATTPPAPPGATPPPPSERAAATTAEGQELEVVSPSPAASRESPPIPIDDAFARLMSGGGGGGGGKRPAVKGSNVNQREAGRAKGTAVNNRRRDRDRDRDRAGDGNAGGPSGDKTTNDGGGGQCRLDRWFAAATAAAACDDRVQ